MADVTQQELKAIFSGDSASYEAAVNRMNNANKRLIESDNKVKNQFAGFTKDLMNADSVAGAFGGTMDRLSETFKVGLGVGVAAVGVKLLIDNLLDANEETKKLVENFEKLAAKGDTAIGQSAEQLKANIIEARKAAEEARNRQAQMEGKFGNEGFIGGLKNAGNTILNPGQRLQFEAEKKDNLTGSLEGIASTSELNAQRELAALEKERTKIARDRFFISEESAKRQEMETRHLEERANAERFHNKEGRQAIAERQAIEKQVFDYAETRALDRINLEEELIDIQAEGDRVAIRSADTKLKYAKRTAEEAKGRNDRAVADNAVKKAEQELRVAMMQDELRRNGLKLEQTRLDIQNSTISAREKSYKAAQAELAAAQAELQAVKDINSELGQTAQLKVNAANTKLVGEQFSAFREDPAARRRRIREQNQEARDAARDKKRFEEQGGLTDVRRDVSGKVIGGKDPITGRDVTLPKESKEQADKAFKEQFQRKRKGDKDAEEQKAKDEADKKKADEAGKGGEESKIVSKLDEIKTELQNLRLQ